MRVIVEPGTIVKLRTGRLTARKGSPAILISMRSNGLVRLLTEAGTALVVRNQVTVSRSPIPSFVPMRLRLPYGVWTEKDGSKVLFSRDYCPMWRISPTGQVSAKEPWHWINFVQEKWWWDDARTPWRNYGVQEQIEHRMAELGVNGVPKLVSVVDMLVRGEAENIRAAVRLMAPQGEPIHVQ